MPDQLLPGNYPPPPPRGYPPSPPDSGRHAAPPQIAAAYPPPPATAGHALPADAYTAWGTRVLALLIDAIPVLILEGIGWGLLLGTRETVCLTDSSDYNNLDQICATGASTLGLVSIAVTALLAFIYWIWNRGYRQGTTGSSVGKSIMKFKIINEKTGQPAGFGISLVRELLYGIAPVSASASSGSSRFCSRCGIPSDRRLLTRSSATPRCRSKATESKPNHVHTALRLAW